MTALVLELFDPNNPPIVHLALDPPAVHLDYDPAMVIIPIGVGIPGSAGGAPAPIEYDLIAVSSWGQAHSFPYPPDVELVRSNERVYAGASYPDSTHVSVTFPAPFTGKVILR